MSNDNSFWHQKVFESTRSKIIALVLIGLVLVSLAVLVWAYQSDKFSSSADTGSSTVMNISTSCSGTTQTDNITWSAYSGAKTYSVKVYKDSEWQNISSCYHISSKSCSYTHSSYAYNYRVIAHTSSANVLYGEKRASQNCTGTTTTATSTATATSCSNECTPGDSNYPFNIKCTSDNQYSSCQNVNGCYKWTGTYSCGTGYACSNSQGCYSTATATPTYTTATATSTSTTASCTSGAVRCNGDIPQKCFSGEWANASTSCALSGQTCSNGSCVDSTSTATATSTAVVTTLSAPTNVTATLQSDGTSVIIKGDNKYPTESYKIYNADTNVLIAQTDASNYITNGYTITGLKCGTTYNYYVVASADLYNAGIGIAYPQAGYSDSGASATVSVTTAACSSGDSSISSKTPSNFTAESGDGYVQLNWSAVDGATGYDIYNCSGALITTTSDISYKFTGLDCGGTYCYYVKAHDASGNESQSSAQASATTSDCSATESGDTSSTISSISSLVSTGGSLWINIIIALAVTGCVGYFMFRKEIYR